MADASRDTLRGLLIEDPRLRSESSIWTAESAGLTQAGRHVGRPTTSDTTSWRVEARGDQSEALDVQVLRSGRARGRMEEGKRRGHRLPRAG
jgi:hypothetical protein